MAQTIANALRGALERRDYAVIREVIGDRRAVEIPIDVLNMIPAHPRQRNTEKRAEEWLRKRSLVYRDEHEDVFVAMLPTGELWILDGHTRRHMWSVGARGNFLEKPPGERVNLIIKPARDREHALEMIRFYDNGLATETAGHILQGTQSEHGQEFQSPLLRGAAGHKDAISYSYAVLTGNVQGIHTRGANLQRAGTPLLPELYDLFYTPLLLIDRTMPTSRTHQAQILAAELLTTIVDGPKAISEFFGPYVDAHNHQQDGERMNAFKWLFELRNSKGAPKSFLGGFHHYSGSHTYDNILKVLRIYEEHLYRQRHGRNLLWAPGEWEATGLRRSHKGGNLDRFYIADNAEGIRARIARFNGLRKRGAAA